MKCPDVGTATPSKTRSLSVDNVGGVFLILVIGMVLALTAAIFEYLVIRKLKVAKNRVIFICNIFDLNATSCCAQSPKPNVSYPGKTQIT